MRECAERMKKPVHGLTPTAERQLLGARWDGNVRELKNVIERACMLADGTLLSERELAGAFGPERPASGFATTAAAARTRAAGAHGGDSAAPLEEIEREHILEVLRQLNGNRMAAAKVLGISRRALYRRLERHHLTDEAPPPMMRRPQ
jgi:DNA-binding NtrC family response regulator